MGFASTPKVGDVINLQGTIHKFQEVSPTERETWFRATQVDGMKGRMESHYCERATDVCRIFSVQLSILIDTTQPVRYVHCDHT